MDNNESNRRIRYALQLDDAETYRVIRLGGGLASMEQVTAWRAREEEADYQACPDAGLSALLDGLILDRRGPPPLGRADATASGPSTSAPGTGSTVKDSPREADGRKNGQGDAAAPSNSNRFDNNTVLKQLRIALSLRADDVHTLISLGGGRLGKTEVSAFFRNPQARNFRRCGDQVMRWFLNGLAAQRDQK